MSRIGKKEIKIPAGVTVEVNGNEIVVKGLKGELNMTKRPEVGVIIEDDTITCSITVENKSNMALWGLTRALIANMITGVVEGFEKNLELVGVGYRATSKGPKAVSLAVGYSNPVEFEAPEGIEIEVEDQKKIKIKGINKDLVGLTAARIRKVRLPEPYKGKGIKYADEVVRRKAGKAGKSA